MFDTRILTDGGEPTDATGAAHDASNAHDTSDASGETDGTDTPDTSNATAVSRIERAAAAATVSFDLIVAVAANGVIGADGEMPWHLPADLRRFRRTTTGHPVILGRRTYDSIVAQLGEPLPDRTSVVLSRSDPTLPGGAVHAESVPAAIRLADADAADRGRKRAFVAGGATVYEAFLPVADRLLRTELDAAHDGDTRFPDWDPAAWTVTEREERESFAFVTYERPE